jgi:hypothetical protein
MSLLLNQPLSQPASYLVATMWIAGRPSDGKSYQGHTLPSHADMLHILSDVTHITISQRPYYPHLLYIRYIPLKYYTNKTFSVTP